MRRQGFNTFMRAGDKQYVYVGNDSTHATEGMGMIAIMQYASGNLHDGLLKNVLYDPTFKKNLNSTNVDTAIDMLMLFEGNQVKILNVRNETAAEGVKYYNDINYAVYLSE